MRLLTRLILVAASLAGTQSVNGGTPNIVLIISDDQAWTDYGFMGHPVIRTPNLDRLAAESQLFTRGYVPSSLCRPSLATIISGLYPHQHKIVGNDPAPLLSSNSRPDRQSREYFARRESLVQHMDQIGTLPKLLKDAGYVSLQTGKWWEGHPSRGGFTHGMTHGDPARGGRHGDEGLKVGRQGIGEIKDFISQARADETPFFVWYAPFLPHTPHNPPPRLLSQYQTDDREIELAKYYAMCTWFDETCGELIGYLDRENLSESTLVIYVTDNGWIQRTATSVLPDGWSQPFAPRSKRSPNEGGVRTPIMFRRPGTIEPHRDEESLASSIDLLPTILQHCELPLPDGHPGINLLDETAVSRRASIFGEIFDHDVADVQRPSASLLYRWVISGRWKLIQPYGMNNPDSHSELYDLSGDPHENSNLIEKRPEIVTRLTSELDAWWRP